MRTICPPRESFYQTLKQTKSNSLDFVIVVTAALNQAGRSEDMSCLDECVRVLKDGGVLFVQGRPEYLPALGVYLDKYLRFKYWIAIESEILDRDYGLPSAHAAILLFVKGNGRFNIRPTRFPHQYCRFCGRPLKDWGGKTHLMHPEGYAISDVWKDLPPADNYTQLSKPVLDTILQMVDCVAEQDGKTSMLSEIDGVSCELTGIIGPREGIDVGTGVAEPVVQYRLAGFDDRPARYPVDASASVDNGDLDVVYCGDALEILKNYPDNSIDLVFADPPYNLDKAYNVYDDQQRDEEYIRWCNRWLQEYVRILKPTGSLYVLNLPRWTMYHAVFLNQHLYFQNWIVWDALSEPRGKLMPAHYGLLFYTKHPTDFTFNYSELAQLDARYYCLRPSCIRKRKSQGVDDKMPLTDIWWDIHRLKHRRDRDYHPCQLPDALLERIVRLSTREGDVVLDAFCGTGTTPVVAARLGRRYVAIDIDAQYVAITQEKLAEVKQKGRVERGSVRRPRQPYTKRELQLELRDLATRLGRLPTPEDVQQMSRYDVRVFFEVFPTWGKALKAAKLEVKS